MIRDLIVLTTNGISVFSHNFGECHSFSTDINLFSGFLSAIQMMSQQLTDNMVSLVELNEKKLAFHKTNKLIYSVICDNKDSNDDIRLKLDRISALFEDKYYKTDEKNPGTIYNYDEFAQLLIDLKITQKNCGGRPECEGCPNSSKTLPLNEYIEAIEKKRGIFHRLFRRNKK